MFWNKKEDKKSLPDLSPFRKQGFVIKQNEGSFLAPISSEIDEENAKKHELPSFPDSLSEKGFSQAAIKDAVGSNVGRGQGRAGQGFKTVEMEEWSPQPLTMSKSDKVIAEPMINTDYISVPPLSKEMNISRNSKNADIFIKLDKFYSARKALSDANQKLQDVDELLRRIRETKMREEQEMSAWETELIKVKSRVNEIAQNLFEKVD